MLARRLDSVEQKLNGQDQAHRTLMEQIMKLNQEMKVVLQNFLVSTFGINMSLPIERSH